MLLLLLLLWWTLALVGAILIYPALGLVAALRAYPPKWGPNVLFLAGALRKLLVLLLLWWRTLLILRVLGRDLGCVAVVLLQERVEIILFLLVGRGQIWAGALALVPL